MIKQSRLVVVGSWMFIGLLVAKVAFYLLNANLVQIAWIEQHYLLTINSISILFGLCGLGYMNVRKRKND